MKRFSLNEAIAFHGHLGPYLVLGLLMGKYALKVIQARPHFGLNINVYGANKKPKSCLIDGLQLSTGCTFGKGNISKFGGKAIRVTFTNCETKKSLTCALKKDTVEKINRASTHKLCETLARKLYKLNPKSLFDVENTKKQRGNA